MYYLRRRARRCPADRQRYGSRGRQRPLRLPRRGVVRLDRAQRRRRQDLLLRRRARRHPGAVRLRRRRHRRSRPSSATAPGTSRRPARGCQRRLHLRHHRRQAALCGHGRGEHAVPRRRAIPDARVVRPRLDRDHEGRHDGLLRLHRRPVREARDDAAGDGVAAAEPAGATARARSRPAVPPTRSTSGPTARATSTRSS